MALNAEQVANSYRLMTGALLSEAEAQRRAGLLWSREELLAALIVREEALRPWPALSARLREVARRSYTAPRTPRAEKDDGVLLRAASLQAAAVLEALVLAERDRIALSDAAHDAIRQQALSWPDPATHPGYHWCVSHEPRQ